MRKVGSLLVGLILLLNVSLGYTLTVNTAGGMTTRNVESGRVVTAGLSNRKPANYVVDSNNAVLKVYGNRRQFVMPSDDVEITISSKEDAVVPETYMVTLDRQGTTNGTESVTVTYGHEMPQIAIPTKTGYVFEGYYTETNGNGAQYYNADGSSTTNWDLKEGITLYAKWREISKPGTPNLIDAHDTGSSNTDNITKYFEDLQIEGSTTANNTITVYKDGEYCGQAITDSNGYWTTTIDNNQNAWTNYTVTATDANGNVSGMSDALSIYSDTVAPVLSVPEIKYNAFTLSYELGGYSVSPIGQVGTTSGDPMIIFSNTNEFGTINQVEIGMSAISHDTFVQVFYDSGNGFNETESAIKTISAGTTNLIIDIPLGIYNKIRVDIGQDGGINYWVYGISFVQNQGVQTRYHAFDATSCEILNYSVSPIGQVGTTGNDPQIIFGTGGLENIRKVEINLGTEGISIDCTVQIFYDMGNGFNESDSVKKNITTGTTSVLFDLPQNTYYNIRVDIGQSSGINYWISDIAFIAPAGQYWPTTANRLSGTDAMGIAKYQKYSSLTSVWEDCSSIDGYYRSAPTQYVTYKAIDKAGNEFVTNSMKLITKRLISSYSYTGSSYTAQDNLYWYIYFTSSGTLTIDSDDTIDVFLVGGGGGGCGGWTNGAGGGGGGYTNTVKNISIGAGQSYTITVGAGGAGGAGSNTQQEGTHPGSSGGASSAFGYSANGGKGATANHSNATDTCGGAGGSGGGGASRNGGSNGSDGGTNGGDPVYYGGKGQGTSTRAFGEASGTLYAGGGGGAYGGSGGSGGGGAGAPEMWQAGTNGTANTGGGGGGAGLTGSGGSGGSGIVIIRGKM